MVHLVHDTKNIVMDFFPSSGVGEYAYNIGPLHIKVL